MDGRSGGFREQGVVETVAVGIRQVQAAVAGVAAGRQFEGLQAGVRVGGEEGADVVLIFCRQDAASDVEQAAARLQGRPEAVEQVALLAGQSV